MNRTWKILPEHVALAIILVVAAVLRFYHYASFSFSNDELSAINRLNYNTFSDLVSKGFYVDGHPGGIQVFLWLWSGIFPLTEASLRFPFVILGILTVLFSYLATRNLLGKVAGLFTAAAISFLQFPLLYSKIARPYGAGLFFILVFVYFWSKVAYEEASGNEGRPKVLHFAGLALSAAACMYSHYFSFLLAMIIGITGLLVIPAGKRLYYVGSGVLAVLLFLPHLQITLNHLSYKGVGLWLGKPGPDWLLHHLRFILNDSIITVFLFVSVSVLANWKGRSLMIRRGLTSLLLAWFLLPFLIAYFYSILVDPVLQHPVLIFSFPFLIMLLFIAAGNEFGRFQQWVLAVFLIGGILSTVAVNRYYSSQHFGEFRDIARKSCEADKKYGADKISRVAIVNSPFYLDYYFGQTDCHTKFDIYDIRSAADMQDLAKLVRGSEKPYFLYAWTKPSPEGVEDIIQSKYPSVIQSIHYGTLSAFTLFGKQQGNEFESGLDLQLVSADSLYSSPANSTNATGVENSPISVQLDSLTEYSMAIEKKMDIYSSSDAYRIVATVDLKTLNIPSGAFFVISLEKEGKSLFWKASQADYFVDSGEKVAIRNSCDLRGLLFKGATMKIYVWNKAKGRLELNNMKLRIYKYGNHYPFSNNQQIWGDTQ